MASSDLIRDSADNGPDTTPGIAPTGPVPLLPPTASDTAFRPPEREGVSGLTVGLGAAVVVLGLYVLINWPWSPQPADAAAEPLAATAAAVSAAPALDPAPAVPGSGRPLAVEPTAPTNASAAVHRCEKAGQVMYTDGPCPNGMRGSAVNTGEALSVAGERGATLYRCRGAGQFWSIVHCQHRGAEIVSMHTVPANLPLAEQILFAQNRESLGQPVRAPAQRAGVVGPPAPLTAASRKGMECQRLEEGVVALDAYARQPLSGGEQDRVSRQRKELRDQQFRLRCGR